MRLLADKHQFCIACMTLFMLTGCVSSESRVLVPSIAMSPEFLQLNSTQPVNEDGVDFGLDVVTNESDSLFNLEVLPGVRVRAVEEGGPAGVAGIQVGDVILLINGQQINHPDTLTAVALNADPDTSLDFQLRRDTTILQATVAGRDRLASAMPLTELYRIDPLRSRAGYITEVIDSASGNPYTVARIVAFDPASPLPDYGLELNDLVISLENIPIESGQDLITRLNSQHDFGDRVRLSILRDNAVMVLETDLWDPGRRINRVSLGPLLQYESNLGTQSSRFSFLDFWLFSVYRYTRTEGERQHRLLELFTFSSDYGALVEERN